MTFQIVRTAPTYCQITDGIIGSHESWRSHAYETSALALKIAGRLAEIDEAFGDDSFHVVPFDASAFDRSARILAPLVASDDFGF